MKHTVMDWTIIQNRTNDDGEGNLLYDKIELRTLGKHWTAQVAIALNKREEELVAAAWAKRDEPLKS